MAAQASHLLTFFLALYLATGSRVLSASGDSVYYLNAIDAGTDLFHPHHLLYNPVARLWVGAWRSLGVDLDTAVLAPWLNSLFGAFGLAVFHGILRTRLGMRPAGAWPATCLPGLSFAHWLYRGSVEVYRFFERNLGRSKLDVELIGEAWWGA